MVAALSSSADALLADVAGYAQLTVSTNYYHTATLEQILACKETVLYVGTVVVAHKLAEGKLILSASCIFVVL